MKGGLLSLLTLFSRMVLCFIAWTEKVKYKLENSCFLVSPFVSHITPVPFVFQVSRLLFQLSPVSPVSSGLNENCSQVARSHPHSPIPLGCEHLPRVAPPMEGQLCCKPCKILFPSPWRFPEIPADSSVSCLLLSVRTPQSYTGATETWLPLSPEKAPTLK